MPTRHEMHDVLVVLPGIMGSTLHRNGKPVWEPSGGALLGALRSLLGNIRKLQLPAGLGDAHPGDGVVAKALIPDIRLPFGLWTFDLGYSKLLDFLRNTFEVNDDQRRGPVNLVAFPYDWRLSNRFNGEALRDSVEPVLDRWRAQGGADADAQLVFICHSMGGLVARWYLDQLGGGAHTRRLITLGTPHRGALNALDQLVNGVRKGPGPFKLDLTSMARSLPSIHQLLPEYACIEAGGSPGGLAKTTETAVPELVTGEVADALAFHTQIDSGRTGAAAGAYQLHPIVGFKQPTMTTARIAGGKVVGVRTIGGKDEAGDATVPRLSAAPPDVDGDEVVVVADNHGGLVHNRAVFDQIEGILTASEIRHRGGEVNLSVTIEEVLEADEPLEVKVKRPTDDEPLELVVSAADGNQIGAPIVLAGEARTLRASVVLPAPGVYLATVRGEGPAGATVRPITTTVLQWPPEALLAVD